MGKCFKKLIDLEIKEKKTILVLDESEKQKKKTKEKLEVFWTDVFFLFFLLFVFLFVFLLIQQLSHPNLFMIFYSMFSTASVIVLIKAKTHLENNKKAKKTLFISRKKNYLAEKKKLNFLTKNLDNLYAEILNNEIEKRLENEDLIETILIRKKNKLKEQLPKIECNLSKSEKLIKEIQSLNKEVLNINTY